MRSTLFIDLPENDVGHINKGNYDAYMKAVGEEATKARSQGEKVIWMTMNETSDRRISSECVVFKSAEDLVPFGLKHLTPLVQPGDVLASKLTKSCFETSESFDQAHYISQFGKNLDGESRQYVIDGKVKEVRVPSFKEYKERLPQSGTTDDFKVFLHSQGITSLAVAGAYDAHCVAQTALHAAGAGLKVRVKSGLLLEWSAEHESLASRSGEEKVPMKAPTTRSPSQWNDPSVHEAAVKNAMARLSGDLRQESALISFDSEGSNPNLGVNGIDESLVGPKLRSAREGIAVSIPSVSTGAPKPA